MKKRCKYCSFEVVTYVEHETNSLFGLTAILIAVVFGFLSCIILPVVYLITQVAVHRCSRCLQTLGQRSCIGLPEDLS